MVGKQCRNVQLTSYEEALLYLVGEESIVEVNSAICILAMLSISGPTFSTLEYTIPTVL